ncbi:hypothetical protein [Phaeacidiphilus oryzae]|uniref:hypothetical protein n=1 Tax=Phaeacidiphilus oryzae TaxID=348818 RepID=UPI00055DA858|nr:hypothetical protein [Phaeacidiphilus oryzae]
MATAAPASALVVLVVAAGLGLAAGVTVAVRTGGGRLVRRPRPVGSGRCAAAPVDRPAAATGETVRT